MSPNGDLKNEKRSKRKSEAFHIDYYNILSLNSQSHRKNYANLLKRNTICDIIKFAIGIFLNSILKNALIKKGNIIMSKSLSNILTVFKVIRILAKVVFILCIVGGVGSLIGLVMLPFSHLLSPEALSDFGIESAGGYSVCIIGLITCVGEAYFAFAAEKYFRNVLNSGTPFTFDGAKECFRLGLVSIIVSVAVSVAAGIVLGIASLLSASAQEIDVNLSFSLTTGLFLIFISMIFKYGAEIKSSNSYFGNDKDDIIF